MTNLLPPIYRDLTASLRLNYEKKVKYILTTIRLVKYFSLGLGQRPFTSFMRKEKQLT